MLAGTIVRARLYDRALDPAEVAASARTSGDYVDARGRSPRPCPPSAARSGRGCSREIEATREALAAPGRTGRTP